MQGYKLDVDRLYGRRLERHYLDGHTALLSEPAERLALLVEGADILLGLCVDLPTFEGLGASVEDIETQTDATRDRLIAAAEPRVEAAVTRLADEATASTLGLLGEVERSVEVMARHVRTFVEVPAASASDGTGSDAVSP